jgi:transposase
MTLERNVAIPRCPRGEAADVHGQVQVGDLGRVRRRPEGGEGGVVAPRGLYSSHIVEWRKARDAGALAGLAVPRGRKRRDPQAEKIARLEAEKRQLEQELAKARFVVDVQAKLHALLGTLSESADTEPRSTP